MRSKSKPSNPQTASQMAVRAQFGAIASAWRNLTENARSAWRESASNFPYINRLGDSKTLSGFALHQKLNTNLELIDEDALQFPPEPISPANFSSLSVEASFKLPDVNTLEITAPLIEDEASGRTLVFATPPLSAGVENFDNKLRLITVHGSDELGEGLDVNAEYEAVFGTLPIGAKVGFRVQNISTLSGVASAPMYATAIKADET